MKFSKHKNEGLELRFNSTFGLDGKCLLHFGAWFIFIVQFREVQRDLAAWFSQAKLFKKKKTPKCVVRNTLKFMLQTEAVG